VVVLTSFSTYILFLPFSLLAFDVNGQTSLIFELLCDLLYSYVYSEYVPSRRGQAELYLFIPHNTNFVKRYKFRTKCFPIPRMLANFLINVVTLHELFILLILETSASRVVGFGVSLTA